MGLDLTVPGTGWFHHVGSYTQFHSFRLTVARALEGGHWGRRFPHLMRHSDCDGDYPPDAARALLHELATIRAALRVVPYPCVRPLAPTPGVPIRYGHGHDGCSGAARGVRVGVTARGLVLRRDTPHRSRYFTRLERVATLVIGTDRRGVAHRLVEPWRTGADLLLDRHTVVIPDVVPADHVFAFVIDALETGARLAVDTDQPLVFR